MVGAERVRQKFSENYAYVLRIVVFKAGVRNSRLPAASRKSVNSLSYNRWRRRFASVRHRVQRQSQVPDGLQPNGARSIKDREQALRIESQAKTVLLRECEQLFLPFLVFSWTDVFQIFFVNGAVFLSIMSPVPPGAAHLALNLFRER